MVSGQPGADIIRGPLVHVQRHFPSEINGAPRSDGEEHIAAHACHNMLREKKKTNNQSNTCSNQTATN
ncbi:MAG: hypothetical protein O7D30_06710, partial [Rickettsia endosymbiont of Ixodes persulcatus]|nr:hypothetical protein [Rickettsia endosymbiont of Ixodes persulcatus]